MLAQNFKTAKQLKLTNKQYDALKKVLVLMETGKLKHQTLDYANPAIFHEREVFTGKFNMAVWASDHGCGTVSCIGGTAELVANSPHLFDEYRTDALYELFQPGYCIYDDITVEQAARALRNFLTHGEPRWEEVLCTSS